MNQNSKTEASARIDYGLDAPGLMRMFFVLGAGAAIIAVSVRYFVGLYFVSGVLVPIGLFVLAFYFLGMGSLMVCWSKFIKLRDRDHALDLIAWRGDEQVLDVGCGRGLMLIGAARRLSTGRAVGVDIWSAKDQSSNTPDAVRNNAETAGVADKVDVQTADMRSLPFEANFFDVVVSHWVVHNLEREADRVQALSEMVRVLCPGGKLIVVDIEHRNAYLSRITSMGLRECRIIYRPFADRILAVLSFGSFQPSILVATKPSA